MRIPDREAFLRRLHLSCIACCAIGIPLALAGPGPSRLIILVWGIGALEYAIWAMRAVKRRRAAEAGLDPETDSEMRRVCPMYASLPPEEASRFRSLAAVFLAEHPVTGVSGVGITPWIRAVVASSAVMLVYGRRDWDYEGLGEVLVYPASFADDGSFDLAPGGGRRSVLGMAHGLGTVILSLPHLQSGPGTALAVHEFAHVLDGVRDADGIPAGLGRDERRRWRAVLSDAMAGGLPNGRRTAGDPPPSTVEFLAEAAELFFCSPQTLVELRPALYEGMKEVFRLDPASFPTSPERAAEPPVRTADTKPRPSFRRPRREAPSRAFRDRASRRYGRRGDPS